MKKLGFGCMRFPLLDANDQKSVDKLQVTKMIDKFIEEGFTYFDTAYMYHNFISENVVKECLVDRYPRDKFSLTDKLPSMMLKEVGDNERIFNEQLQKCGVDYFDVYLLHNLGVKHYALVEKFDSFTFLKRLKKEGKAKKIGFSYHDNADLLDKILAKHHEGLDFIQLQINYLDWEDEGIQSRKCYKVVRKYGLEIIVMEPIKGGALANISLEAQKLFKDYSKDASIASWAIRYVASLEGVRHVLSGMSTLEQLIDNTSYMKDFKPLNDEEKEIIEKVSDIIKSEGGIPCTACEYCTKVCPQAIPIPQYFHLYNNKNRAFSPLAINPKWSIQDLYYSNLTTDFAKASDCIGCRVCESECPQHIEISQELINVVNLFENN